jgi:5-deoxy-D-glucuronate isomerase
MLTVMSDGVPIIIQRVRDETHDVVDLEQLAAEHSSVGYIAQHILNLESGAGTEELERAEARIQVVVNGGWNVDDDDYPLPSMAELLQRAARRVLGTLLEQRREVEA